MSEHVVWPHRSHGGSDSGATLVPGSPNSPGRCPVERPRRPRVPNRGPRQPFPKAHSVVRASANRAGPVADAALPRAEERCWLTSEVILSALTGHLCPVAAFCVLWPSDFAARVGAARDDCIAREEVLAVPRDVLARAFAIELDNGPTAHRPQPVAWDVAWLPSALRRAPFLVSAATRLTLPFHIDGVLLGFAGVALPSNLGLADHPWYSGFCAAVTSMLALSGTPATAEPPPDLDEPSKPSTCGDTTRLSRRELEVGKLLADGHSTLNVGARLGLSVCTVRTYVRRLYVKLQVYNRVDLARCLRA